MQFDARKCNIIIMWRTSTHNPHQYFYSLGVEILKEISDAKYLGIQRESKLDRSKHILILQVDVTQN